MKTETENFNSFQVLMELMAKEAAARHQIPKATVQHPKGVICKGDPL